MVKTLLAFLSVFRVQLAELFGVGALAYAAGALFVPVAALVVLGAVAMLKAFEWEQKGTRGR